MNVESAILQFIFDIANEFLIVPEWKEVRSYKKTVKAEKDLKYSDKCPACVLDIYYQKKKPSKKRPAVINIHGGGLIIGDKVNSKCWCYEIAGESDTVVFNINYGLPSKDITLFNNLDPNKNHSDDYCFPMPIQTHMDAIRYVMKHADEYGVDLDNVFIAGDSAGSQMTAMVMACFANDEFAKAYGVDLPNINPKGFIMNCGLYNMDIYKYIPIARCMMAKAFGTNKPHKTDLWKYHNSMKFLNNKIQNAMVVKGRTDILTFKQSDMMVKALKKAGVPTEFYLGASWNPMYSFHDFLLSPTDEGKKAVAATRDWIAKCSK